MGFPVEWVNTVSNLPTILFGLFALYLVYHFAPKRWELYLLAFLLLATGIGSTLWHGTRLSWALTYADVMPGVFFLLAFVFAWGRTLWSAHIGLGILILLFALQYVAFNFVSWGGFISPFTLLFLTLFFAGSALVWFSWKRFGVVGGTWALLTLSLAAMAAVMRTVDGPLCDVIPFGTHLFWHIFLGGAGLAGIYMLLAMRRVTSPLSQDGSQAR